MTTYALVVEDERALCRFYDYLLNKQGYDVLIAADGKQAVTLLERHQPELIFLDMRLPLYNGDYVLSYIASRPELAMQTHVVIVSSSIEYASHTTRVPSAEFVQKPLLPDTINTIIARQRRQQATT